MIIIDNNLLYNTAKILIDRVLSAKVFYEELITYQELSDKVNKVMGYKKDKEFDAFGIKEPIGELSKIAHRIDLPLISGMVINGEEKSPGGGFFTLYTQLLGIKVKTEQRDEIWLNECKKIYECREWNLLLTKLNPNHISEKLNCSENGTLNDCAKEYAEGSLSIKEHINHERNSKVIKDAKINFLRKKGKLFCEVCGFNFYEFYGELGRNYIEGHHTKMVSQMKDGDITKLEDIAMVCCNCHRMLHNNKKLLTIEELRNIINNKKRNL